LLLCWCQDCWQEANCTTRPKNPLLAHSNNPHSAPLGWPQATSGVGLRQHQVGRLPAHKWAPPNKQATEWPPPPPYHPSPMRPFLRGAACKATLVPIIRPAPRPASWFATVWFVAQPKGQTPHQVCAPDCLNSAGDSGFASHGVMDRHRAHHVCVCVCVCVCVQLLFGGGEQKPSLDSFIPRGKIVRILVTQILGYKTKIL